MITRVNCNSIGHCPSLFYQALWSFWGLWTNHVLGSFLSQTNTCANSERGVLVMKKRKKKGFGFNELREGRWISRALPWVIGEKQQDYGAVVFREEKGRTSLTSFHWVFSLIFIVRVGLFSRLLLTRLFTLQWEGRIFRFANAAFVICFFTRGGGDSQRYDVTVSRVNRDVITHPISCRCSFERAWLPVGASLMWRYDAAVLDAHFLVQTYIYERQPPYSSLKWPYRR